MKNKSIGAQKDTKSAFAVALMYAESRTKRKGAKDGADKPKLGDVDKDFILGYVDYLRNTYKKKNGQPLSESTVAQYFHYLGFAMKKAYQRGYIMANPYNRLEREDKPRDRHAKREYLEIDEVQRLIDSGVITGSGFDVNPKSLGYRTCTYVGITLERGSMYKEVVKRLEHIPEVVECHFTTGPYTMLVKLYARDNEQLMHLLNGQLQEIPGVVATETLISLEQNIKREIPVHFEEDVETV